MGECVDSIVIGDAMNTMDFSAGKPAARPYTMRFRWMATMPRADINTIGNNAPPRKPMRTHDVGASRWLALIDTSDTSDALYAGDRIDTSDTSDAMDVGDRKDFGAGEPAARPYI